MQKIWILLILGMCWSLAKSQDSTDYTLNNIKQYATHIDGSFTVISNSIEASKQQAVVQHAENIKALIDSIEEEMQYLPDEYYYRLSPLVSSYHTDVDEFEKLLLNKDFQGKDKFLTTALNGLQQRQSEFSKVLNTAYATATHQQPPQEINPGNKITEENTIPVTEQRSTSQEPTVLQDSNVVLVEAVNPNEITTSNNSLLLDTIHQAQQQIKQWITGIHLAMENNSFSKMGAYANNISNAALKIRDLTLFLKTDQKQSLYILATGLKNLSETLHKLAFKDVAAQDEIQGCVNDIETKFSTLSTGISLVQ